MNKHLMIAVVAVVSLAVSDDSARAQSVSVRGQGASGLPVPIGATGDRLKTHAVLASPDGGEIGTASAPIRTDPTGTSTQPSAAVPQNGSDQCQSVTLPASGAPDGGTYSVTIAANTWHQLEVNGDGNGGWLGCWSYSRLTTMPDGGSPCFQVPGLRDGQQSYESFSPISGVDGGPAPKAVVYFYGTVAGIVVKLCPKTPSR